MAKDLIENLSLDLKDNLFDNLQKILDRLYQNEILIKELKNDENYGFMEKYHLSVQFTPSSKQKQLQLYIIELKKIAETIPTLQKICENIADKLFSMEESATRQKDK